MNHQFNLTDPAFILENSSKLISTHSKSGEYLYANQAFGDVLGYDPDELLGKSIYDLLHKADQEVFKVESHQVSLSGKDVSIESRAMKKDGSWVWLEINSRAILNNDEVVGLILTAKDISKVVDLRSQLLQMQNMLEEAANMADLGAWEVQLDPFEIIWSKTVYDIHEVDYDVKPALLDALSFFVGPDRERIELNFEELLKNGTSYDLTVRFRTAKGGLKWVRTIGKALVDGGKTTKLYGVFQDITDSTNDQIRLKQIADYLERKKMQVQQFNQIVSHNLRAPIANIDILLNHYEETDDPEEKKQYIDFLRQSSDALHTLMEDLVDAVKIQNESGIVTEDVGIEQLFEKVVSTLSVQIATSNATVVLTEVEWKVVEYSRIYLESILMNLISNAIKYCSPDRDPEIVVRALNPKGEFILTVEDNGIGIDLKRHRDKLFKLHKTLDRERSGKGLGLFMTKQQIEALGGDIDVQSKPNVGSVFMVNLLKYSVYNSNDVATLTEVENRIYVNLD